MSAISSRVGWLIAALAVASIPAYGQQDPTAIVQTFYPSALREVDQIQDTPLFSPLQCFAVYDRDVAGAARTIVAGYSNGFTGMMRVLQAGPGGFAVVAEPAGYDFAGHRCRMELLDLDGIPGNEIHLSFSTMGNSTDWVFRWDGQQLLNLTPVTVATDGLLETRLLRADFVDLDNDGAKEIYVISQYPIRELPPLPDVVYRLSGDQYTMLHPVVAYGTFERGSGSPDTDTVPVILPRGARGPFLLHVVNGNGGAARVENAVESGRVWLNGQEIIRPNDFGSNVAFIDREVPLQVDNELKVRLAGSPGSRMSVLITAASWDPVEP
jgi:hypothetical protein